MRPLYYLLKPKFFICLNLLKPNFLQGLILRNALRAQKDAEDEDLILAPLSYYTPGYRLARLLIIPRARFLVLGI